MKRPTLLLLTVGILFSTSAHAWFFFFIPPSATRAIADSITGTKGNICVKEGTEIGQIITSPNGNTAKVLSLSGTSSICPNPALPIRAELEFNFSFTSRAGIDLSDDYQPTVLSDLDKFNGILLKATSKSTKNQGVVISATTKKPNMDLAQMANNIERAMQNSANLKDVVSSNAESLEIAGMPAVRFEISGTLKGIFGQKVTYMYSIIEGDQERVVINTYAPTDAFPERRPDFLQLASSITGLRSTRPISDSEGAASPAESSSSQPPSEKSDRTVSGELEPSDLDPVETRLLKLQRLLKDGLVTQKEFEQKKQEILKSL